MPHVPMHEYTAAAASAPSWAGILESPDKLIAQSEETMSDWKREIDDYLEKHRDAPYGDFQSRLIPGIDPASITGVRTPELRKLAKQLAKRDDIAEFLEALPHARFEENQLHAFIVSMTRDYDQAVAQLDRFLPYVDNWATCDQTSCKVLAKRPGQTLAHVQRWMATGQTYTVRFAIGVMLQFFLDELFDSPQLEMVVRVESDEYYVNMMRAWYFAEALAKQEAAALTVIENNRLDTWTHNKAIQKAIESRRISPDLKAHLRLLRR